MLLRHTLRCTIWGVCVLVKQVTSPVSYSPTTHRLHFHHFLAVVLVLNGASPAGSIAIQLAMMGGVKVLTTAASAEELLYLQNFQPSIGTHYTFSKVHF